MRSCPVLWIVAPCYNEQEALPISAPVFLKKLNEMIDNSLIDENSRILFVNDGSSDQTWRIIRELSETNRHFIGVSLSRNRGHQNALLAGLTEAASQADIVISADCDGQDDLNALDQMVKAYLDGYEIVYGVRSDRASDSWFKRFSAQSFYKFMNFLGCDILYNHADFRLASSRVLRHLADFQEVNLFLRGVFPLIGFPSTVVTYQRNSRVAGETHYPLGKMLALASNGITSLSTKPITFIILLGLVITCLGTLGLLKTGLDALFFHAEPLWAPVIHVICFFTGLEIFSLGVIGEYVGKTYLESKRRPRYIISEKTWEFSNKNGRQE